MQSQECRKKIDWIQLNCGRPKSAQEVALIKSATVFVDKHAPYLDKESTRVVVAAMTIADPIVQGKVLAKLKECLELMEDPRSPGKKIKRLTSPMVHWLIEWATTGRVPNAPMTYKRIVITPEVADCLQIMIESGLLVCQRNGWVDKEKAMLKFRDTLIPDESKVKG